MRIALFSVVLHLLFAINSYGLIFGPLTEIGISAQLFGLNEGEKFVDHALMAMPQTVLLVLTLAIVLLDWCADLSRHCCKRETPLKNKVFSTSVINRNVMSFQQIL